MYEIFLFAIRLRCNFCVSRVIRDVCVFVVFRPFSVLPKRTKKLKLNFVFFFNFFSDRINRINKWSRTGALRPTSGPGYGKRSRNNNGLERHKSKLPRGMYINHDDIVALACPENNSGPNNRNDDLLASMDREMSSLLSQVRHFLHFLLSLSLPLSLSKSLYSSSLHPTLTLILIIIIEFM